MNYEYLIFETLAGFIECTLVYFSLVIILDFMRTMIFSDR